MMRESTNTDKFKVQAAGGADDDKNFNIPFKKNYFYLKIKKSVTTVVNQCP